MTTTSPQTVKRSMRKEWFDHVRKTRVKMSRGKEQVTHRLAMQEASKTWADTKSKIERRHQREDRKAAKARKSDG